MTASAEASLVIMLKTLRLPSVASHFDNIASQADARDGALVNISRSCAKLKSETAASGGRNGSLTTLDTKRLPSPITKRLPTLCDGGFVDRAENVLVFGLPGTGKSHLVCAIGHELVRPGGQLSGKLAWMSFGGGRQGSWRAIPGRVRFAGASRCGNSRSLRLLVI